MKFTKLTNLLVIGLALVVVVSGCRKKGVPPVTRFGPGTSGTQNGGIPEGGKLEGGEMVKPDQMGGGEAATFDPDSMAQDRQTLAPQTVYFAYDSSSVQGAEQSKVDAVAAALTSDMSAKLLIEGNCDERGTEEYNRSLGERRALAVREALAAKGVSPDRVATRSYGEDRPAESGHDDAAWKKNRRDDFVLLHAK
ncbi:MAG: peptidoglycan-associated lipoprotein [Verrucomicrobiota bacterium]|jgi:peptidoglycan-associated lipoprotein